MSTGECQMKLPLSMRTEYLRLFSFSSQVMNRLTENGNGSIMGVEWRAPLEANMTPIREQRDLLQVLGRSCALDPSSPHHHGIDCLYVSSVTPGSVIMDACCRTRSEAMSRLGCHSPDSIWS